MRPTSVIATTTRGVWWPWLGWVTGGEWLGFAVPGVVAVMLAAAPRPVFAVGLPAGAVEGAILGGAQAVVGGPDLGGGGVRVAHSACCRAPSPTISPHSRRPSWCR